MKKTLNEKIYNAVKLGDLIQPFTTNQLKNWIEEFNVVNDKSKKKYATSSINAILSNSDKKTDQLATKIQKICKVV
jgi:hypothetical protein